MTERHTEITEGDRYIWLLANMGRIEDLARSWQPGGHPPLLVWLHRCIVEIMKKENSPTWIERQRNILLGVKND